MATYEQEIALKISTNATKVTEEIQELTGQMGYLKSEIAAVAKEQKTLDDDFKEGKISMEEYGKETARLDSSMETLQTELDNTKKDLKTLNGLSFKDLVNNFKNGIGNAKSFGEAFKVATSTASAGLKMLAANPYMAIIGVAIMALKQVFDALKNAIQNNDSAGTALATTMALLKTPFTLLQNVLNSLMPLFTEVLEWFNGLIKKIPQAIRFFGKLVDKFSAFAWILKQIGVDVKGIIDDIADSMEEEQNRSEQAIKMRDQLEDKEREYTRNHAKREREIEELREKGMDSESYTAAQRKKFLKDAEDLYEKDTEEYKKLINKRIAVFDIEHKTQKELNDEQKNEREALVASLEKADADLAKSKRTLAKNIRSIDKQITQAANEEEKQRIKDAEDAAKERAKIAMQAVKDTQTAITATLASIAKTTGSYQDAFNVLQDDYNNKLKEIQEKAKSLQDYLTNEGQNLTEAQLQQIQDNIDALNGQYKAINKEYDVEKEKLAQKMLSTTNIVEETEKLRIAMMENGMAKEKALENQRYIERLNQLKTRFTAEQQQTAEFQALLREEEAQHQAKLTEIQKKEEAKRKAEREKQEKETQQSTANLLSNTANLFGSIAEAYNHQYQTIVEGKEQLSEEEKSMAIAALEQQKVATKTQVGLQSVMSLGNAVYGATKALELPFPANVIAFGATLAALTASVVSQFTGLDSTLSGIDAEIEKVKKMPVKYATGGYIEGAGTATSDSIPARLSNGEAVINARSTAMYYDLLSAINQRGGGVAFPNAQNSPIIRFAQGGVATNTAQIVEAVKAAVEDIQPVVSVKEITRVQNRIKAKETI